MRILHIDTERRRLGLAARSNRMSGASPRKNQPRGKRPPPPEPEAASPSVMEVLGRGWLRLERYSWDVLGVVLLAGSALTVLALLNLSQGSFISPWGAFLKHWTGAGSYAILFLMAYLGIAALRHQPERASRLDLGRVLALEWLVFIIMALLSLFGGMSLERAETGQDGGVIGWGLARLVSFLLPLPWSSLLRWRCSFGSAWLAAD